MKDAGPSIPGSLGDPRGRLPVLGQEEALAELGSALRSGRMPAAWILHGPEGIGKFSAALRFARLLLEPEPTDECIDSCAHAPQMLFSSVQRRRMCAARA